MEIVDVRAYALSSPIDPIQERPFHGGVRRLVKRDVVLVVVETADGRQGVSTAGASSSAMREYFDGESQSDFADVIEGPVSEALDHVTLDEPSAVREALEESTLPARLLTEAVSAIEIAFWDLRGKELGAPVWELLARDYEAAPSTQIPLYASGGMYMDPEGYARQAEILEGLGFFGYKYRPGIGPDADRETLELLSDRVQEMELMLDVHTWWKLRDAYDEGTVRELVEHAGRRGAYWVEEPVEPDDRQGYVRLAKTGTPLAGGESEPSASGLIDLARTGAIDYLQGDVRHHGGFTDCLSAVEYCRGRDVEFVPHNFGTWLGLLANAHLVAAGPEVRLLEYPVFEGDPLLGAEDDPGMYPFDLAFDIIDGEPEMEDGVLTVPDGPGLGVDVNLDVIEEYPFIEGAWTEFRYDN